MTLYKFTISEIKQDTSDTKIVYLKAEDSKFTFSAGQYASIHFKFGETEKVIPFSIFTTPSELPLIGIAVKDYNDTNPFDSLHVGDEINCEAASGRFIINVKHFSNKTFLFVCNGSGITPIHSLVSSTLNKGTNHKVTLLYGCRDEKSIILQKQLVELQNKFDERFNLFLTLSQPTETWKGVTGRIDFEMIKSVANTDFANTNLYYCGSKDLLNIIIDKINTGKKKPAEFYQEYYSAFWRF